MLSNFNVWMGMSATPIIMEVAVPIIAVAPPEMGSTGPSSIANSRARYLLMLGKVWHKDLDLQFEFREIELAFLSKYCRRLGAQPG
jgi:hypothetical protein